MSKQQRIPQLDGVRGIAILMVVLCHYIQNPLLGVPGTVAKYVAKSLSLGWSGVDLFFVLSGFLICGILVDNKTSPTLFRTFYARRTSRIFPLYFLLLGIFVLLSGRISAPIFENPLPLWSYATFTQNFLMATYPEGTIHWLGQSWSLAVEEQFYLALPLIVVLVPRRGLLPLYVLGIVGAALLRFSLPGHRAFLLTPWRADSLLSGAALALLVRSPRFMSWVGEHRRTLLTSFALLLAGAAAMTAKPWSSWAHNHLWLAMLYSVFILVALVNAIPRLNSALTFPPLMWLGKVSYGVYLIHGEVLRLLYWYVAGRTPELTTWADIAITSLAIVSTLGLAGLSFRYFENPLMKLGQSFKYSAPRPILELPAVERVSG